MVPEEVLLEMLLPVDDSMCEPVGDAEWELWCELSVLVADFDVLLLETDER